MQELGEKGVADRPLTDLVDRVRKRLRKEWFAQDPQLQGSARIMERGLVEGVNGR